MEQQEFANVWDALSDSPDEAANMTMRSNLIIAIQRKVAGWKVTQAEAARRLRITQPRLNDLLRSKIDKFSLDMLVTLASHAGITVRLEIAEMSRGALLPPTISALVRQVLVRARPRRKAASRWISLCARYRRRRAVPRHADWRSFRAAARRVRLRGDER